MEHVQHVGTNVELGGEGDAHSHGGAEQSGIEREEDLRRGREVRVGQEGKMRGARAGGRRWGGGAGGKAA
eukprot:scaffold9928_cov112-Isochrysis_galbana.AAC.3